MKLVCECGKRIRVPEGSAGRKGKCPRCSRVIIVPAAQPDARPDESASAKTDPAPATPATPAETNPSEGEGASSGETQDLILASETGTFYPGQVPQKDRDRLPLFLLAVLPLVALPFLAVLFLVGWLLLGSSGPDEIPVPEPATAPATDAEPVEQPRPEDPTVAGPAEPSSGRETPEPAAADKPAPLPETTPPPAAQPAERPEPGETPPEPKDGAAKKPDGEPGKPPDAAADRPEPRKPDDPPKKAGPKTEPEPKPDPDETALVDRALETRWFLHRRKWTLQSFLKYVESFLGKYGKAHGWGVLRFAMDEDATRHLLEEVDLELRQAPLLSAVEEICRQCKLRYVIDRPNNTVRLTREGKGITPGPRPRTAELKAAEPAWKTPPHRATPEDNQRIRELTARLQSMEGNEAAGPGREMVVRDLGALRTPKALAVLEKLARSAKKDRLVLHAIVRAVASIDGAGAAETLLDFLDRDALRFSSEILLEGLASLRTKEALEALGKQGLRHGSTRVRVYTARVLGDVGWTGSLDALAGAAGSPSAPVRTAAIRAMARIGGSQALECLSQLFKSRNADAAFSAFAWLDQASAESPLVREIARRLLDEGKTSVAKLTAARILGRNRDPSRLDQLRQLLQSKDWRLRSAAIRALGEIRHHDAVGPLIARLRKEKGRLVFEAAAALNEITGLDFGRNPDIWETWWKKTKAVFIPPPILRPARTDHLTAAPAYYHTIPVISKRIIFILDISGSMRSQMVLEKPAEGAPENGSRLEYCCWEMRRTISRFKADVWFNIITFESRIRIWQKTVVKASPQNKARAGKFLEKQNPLGTTNLFDALKRAFEDPHADTLFVLSDGSPDSAPEEILQWVRKHNRTKLLVIHTISAGHSFGGFMKKLAEENGGRAVELK